jgi:hypothetical protein
MLYHASCGKTAFEPHFMRFFSIMNPKSPQISRFLDLRRSKSLYTTDSEVVTTAFQASAFRMG